MLFHSSMLNPVSAPFCSITNGATGNTPTCSSVAGDCANAKTDTNMLSDTAIAQHPNNSRSLERSRPIPNFLLSFPDCEGILISVGRSNGVAKANGPAIARITKQTGDDLLQVFKLLRSV